MSQGFVNYKHFNVKVLFIYNMTTEIMFLYFSNYP